MSTMNRFPHDSGQQFHSPNRGRSSRCQRDPPLPQYAVLLKRLPKDPKPLNPRAIDDLISSVPFPPKDPLVFPSGEVAAKLFFPCSEDAIFALSFLWRGRLGGHHHLFPDIDTRDTSFKLEALGLVKQLLISHVQSLLDGEIVNRLRKKVVYLESEIKKLKGLLALPRGLRADMEMKAEKERLLVELEQLNGRLEEFSSAMQCISSYLAEDKDEEFGVFKFGSDLDMRGLLRIDCRVRRECRRVNTGLPIYSCRRKLLKTMSTGKVMVVIGETGSGKSTQLVQFIADSGAAAGSIICTQPRRIASISVAQRVEEESTGCYDENYVVSSPMYSPCQEKKSRVMFMTDHCLMHQYMGKKHFEGISYIVVDEAHERSLNTDLLLALTRKELLRRHDLRVIIMSATADASKFAEYFGGCPTIFVKGRNFPVDIKYVPDVSSEAAWYRIPKPLSGKCALYVSDVIMMVNLIHKTEEDGAILAFLTSQAEVEWACENFNDSSMVVLPMHGKLSHESQVRVMQSYPGKRKVIFSTNVAETSLTIPDVKYVVDSGMVKESRFEPRSGMNMLKVGRISQSSANQRAGRAGRTGPGKCYRLYSESDFQSMKMHQEPEIRKVHLGIAVLRILALDIKNIQDFDFVDAPDPKAIEKATQNLIQLSAIARKDDAFELTEIGRQLVKLGIEPRLGKIILDSFRFGLAKEGLVLASVMANSSSIFCRVGSEEEKHKADCLKVPFCHRDGDLFTLLSVYKEWEEVNASRNRWCWEHSINAKSMRRCQETLMELENCLRHELNIICPSYWKWNPYEVSIYDILLKKVILASLVENVAMYSGSDQIGYEVAVSGNQLQLHPSCSLLVYGQKPRWVVFGEILSAAHRYLVCVNAVDYSDLLDIQHSLFDLKQLESRRTSLNIINVVGDNLLRRFCGRSNSNLQNILLHIKGQCMVDQISIDVDFGKREIQIVAPANDMEKVASIVTNYLESEKKWLKDECMEKSLFIGGTGVSPVALFGSGAEIRHLELTQRYLTVEIFHSLASDLSENELLMIVEQYAPGIANFYKISGTVIEGAYLNKWGRITFLSPESAENAVVKLNEVEVYGSLLKVHPLRTGDHKTLPSAAVRGRVCWPRRRSKGVALVQCAEEDVEAIVEDCKDLEIGGRLVSAEVSSKFRCTVFVHGIPRDVSEPEIYEAFARGTRRRFFGVNLLKSEAIMGPPAADCVQALKREISEFMPNQHYTDQNFHVDVFEPEPNDHVVRAAITFNGNFYLEAAKALDHLQGKVLPGCQSWQTIQCQHVFYCSVFCAARIYAVIREDLHSLLQRFKQKKGVTCNLERTISGCYCVKISANATKIVADLRKPLENLMKGTIVTHPGLTPSVLVFLLSRDGINLLRSIERETGTYILYERQKRIVRLFGSPTSIPKAEVKLVRSLLLSHEKKPLVIHLRGHNLPPDLMKEVVRRFGADLQGINAQVPGGGVHLSLNTHRHILFARGTKEQKQKTEQIICELASSLGSVRDALPSLLSSECPICLCELEEPYKLESCGHNFCRPCLVDQCESVARSREGFPIRCSKDGCGRPFLLIDLKSLLPSDKLEELFRASLADFVALSGGRYRFCPSPDCPSVYQVADEGSHATCELFVCGACSAETCTRCHLEYHPFISCERYGELKGTPDESLMKWRKGKEHVKECPSCQHTIEKVDGCEHIECRCGVHICWVCLQCFKSSDECYSHIRSGVHS